MPSALRSAVAPLYLLACLVLGGSAQGVWQNALLQLAGVAILAWAAVARPRGQTEKHAQRLLLLAIAAVILVSLQLVPLPPSIWAHGARSRIAEGYAILGQQLPWLPISLTPYESMASLLCLIPPLAMFAAVVRLNAYRLTWLVAALLAGTVAAIMLGVLQVTGAGANGAWYLYPETNFGSAVGFFANANHMATLLLIGLPFLAATAAAAKNRDVQHRSAMVAIAGALALVLLTGIALNRSLAGYLLAVPVLAASALILLPAAGAGRRIALTVAALSMVAAVVALATTGIGTRGRVAQDANASVQTRQVILEKTGKAIGDYMPLGSGLGSFLRVYRLYESPDAVTTDYVIQAHNDYAEVALELGAAGVVLMVAFLAWWFAAAAAAWRTASDGPFARAASIASAAVLLHSLVDFPLRTAAISVCFAMCAALLVDRRQPIQRQPADLRPARHLVFE